MIEPYVFITGGHVLTADPDIPDMPHGDVLIHGDRIIALAPTPPGNHNTTSAALRLLPEHHRNPPHPVQIVDATGFYVTPGFTDPHRHNWETALRAAAQNATFGEYFKNILDRLSPRFTPHAMRITSEAAAYEAITAGVTTLLDWCHNTRTTEHALAASSGLYGSGVRGVFAYGPPHSEWFDSDGQPTPDQVRTLHNHATTNGGHLALGIRGPEFSTMDRVTADIRLARELGIPVTLHAGIPHYYEKVNSVQALHDAGLLGPDLTFVHCSLFTPTDLARIADTGGHVCFAPEVEQQMGLGAPPVAAAVAAGLTPTVSVDVNVAVPGDLNRQAAFGVQTQRMLTQADGDHPTLTAESAFDWLTSAGAAAVGLGEFCGSLTPGKLADLLLIDRSDPNLLGAVNHRGAVALHTHPGNVHTVIIGGHVLRRNRRWTNHHGPGPRFADELLNVQEQVLTGAEA